MSQKYGITHGITSLHLSDQNTESLSDSAHERYGIRSALNSIAKLHAHKCAMTQYLPFTSSILLLLLLTALLFRVSVNQINYENTRLLEFSRTEDFCARMNFNRSLIGSFAVWNSTMDYISDPSPNKKVWALKSANPFLTLVIVEARVHPHLLPVLRNAAHVYGGERGIGLSVFCSKQNENLLKSFLHDWIGVSLVTLPNMIQNPQDYSRLLTNASFWEQLDGSRHVLIFQIDTLFRNKFDEQFFHYEYVGAPWPHVPTVNNRHVGNGGLSLRLVSTMIDICKKIPYKGEPEDVYFANNVGIDMIPPAQMAATFSIEMCAWDGMHYPSALHKPWLFQSAETLCTLLNGLPGLSTQAVLTRALAQFQYRMYKFSSVGRLAKSWEVN